MRSLPRSRHYLAVLLLTAGIALVAGGCAPADDLAVNGPETPDDAPATGDATPATEEPTPEATGTLDAAPLEAPQEPEASPADPSAVALVQQAAEQAADEALAAMDLDTKLGQLLTVRVYGSHLDHADPRNERVHGVETPAEVLDTLRPGGIILFDRVGDTSTGNLDDPAQTRALTDALRAHATNVTGVPVLVAVDREGGRVDRLARIGTKLPAPATIGQADHAPQLARAVADVAALELKALGIDVNYAPVADLAGPQQPGAIGDRSFELDPKRSARLAAISIRAHLDAGVAPTAKHFPGHGATTVDSHDALPTVTADEEVLEERELIPFRAAIRAGVPIVMTGHLAVPALDPSGTPASVSHPMITELLRGDMGFDGVVVADALEMAGVRDAGDDVAVQALRAGTDVLLLPPNPQETVAQLRTAVEDGDLSEERVDESVRRILVLKHRLGLMSGEVERPDASVVGSPALAERLEWALRGEPVEVEGADPTNGDE